MLFNLERHRWLNSRLGLTEGVLTKLYPGANRVEGSGELCVVTEGAAYNYVREVLEDLGVGASVVKLSLLYPPPTKFLEDALRGCREVLVVEELDPYLETVVKKVLYELGTRVPVYGKESGHIPREGELSRRLVAEALVSVGWVPKTAVSPPAGAYPSTPPRPPPMCPGCPHRNTYLALLLAIARAGYRRDEVPIFGDIGCYALSFQPPFEAIWTEHSMGASISMAMGLKVAGYGGPVVATIGDSTLFHAGLQPLLEAVHKRVDVLVVVLDNSVVAMTGHQSTPAWGTTESGRRAKPISIEEVVRALGADRVYVVDPYDLDLTVEVLTRALREPGVRVVVARHPCALMEVRARGVTRRYRVVEDRCTGCLACVRTTGCPALYYSNGRVRVSEEDCVGCGLCARFCPYRAFEVVEVG